MSPKKHKTTDIYDLLKSLVAIPSIFPNEGKVEQYIAKYLHRLGFNVTKVPTSPGRNNIVAVYGKASKYVGFYGHLDTVEPDPHYKHNPFTVRKIGDIVSGLGTADMKGGICAILELARFASANDLPVKIIMGVDEENISAGAHTLINAKVLKDVSFLVSAESGQVKDLSKPYSVCYGRRGRMAISVTVEGKRAHGAESHKAINAIEKSALFISKLTDLKFSNNANFGRSNIIVQEIESTSDSFSVPDECTVKLSALTAPPTSHQAVIKKLQVLAKKLGVNATVKPTPRSTPYSESYEVNKSDKFLRLVESKVFKPAGVKPIYSESVADENVFAKYLPIPVISIGPIGGDDHTANEWVSLSSIENVADCYKQILKLYTKP